MTRRIAVFDTTLRDGEQSPGASMSTKGKVAVARQLLRLGVDVIEAGFPISSPGDRKSVQRVAELAGDAAVVCALARAVEADIDAAAEALAGAARPRIHTGLGVSPIHLSAKLRMTEDDCLERTRACVAYARNRCDDVQFYAEDAARADRAFLARVVAAALSAGATVINIPDTTGYSLPEAFGGLVRYLYEHVDGLDDVTLSVHCHNDLGLACALSLAGISAGATQVECTVNGLGERAGNTALEEVVMALAVHGRELDAHTGIDTRELVRTSRVVQSITGMPVQANKAIVGANAFAHSSGIHQDGVLKDRGTYEIIDPQSVGAGGSDIILSARSGRAALVRRLEDLGYTFDDETNEKLYQRFLEIADHKSELFDEDLMSLVNEVAREAEAIYRLQMLQVSCGFPLTPTATLTLSDEDGAEHTVAAFGDGPIDVAFQAVNDIVGIPNELSEYIVTAVTRGIDAIGEVTVRVKAPDGRIFIGRGSDTDIVVSSTKAYLNALNRMIAAGRAND